MCHKPHETPSHHQPWPIGREVLVPRLEGESSPVIKAQLLLTLPSLQVNQPVFPEFSPV